jgi:hypothetical protein
MSETSTELAIRAPASMSAKVEYCNLLSDSGLLPSAYRGRPANVLYAVEYGEMIGLPPLAAITGVHIIEGKPTASAGLISALVRRAGHRFRAGYDAKTRTGWAEIVRSDDPEFTFRSEWDLDRAVEAELCTIQDGKPFAVDKNGRSLPWRKFFPSMVKARATTEVARDACEEILFGLHYTPEELGMDVDDDGLPVTAQSRDEPPLATKAQLTKIAILCKEKRGVTDRAARLAVVCEVIGREIESSAQLFLSEASTAIETLSAEDDLIADAETVPDAPEDVQNRLLVLLEQRLDLTDHDDRMAWISGELNRHVATAADLTLPEATGLIERLEATPQPGQPWEKPPQVPPADGAAQAAQAKAEAQQAGARQRDGSWSHQMLADRGVPLTTKADGSDQMFEDMAIAIADASDPNELEGLYLAAKNAHTAGKITAAQFAKLDELGRAQNEDLRAKAAAMAGAGS